MNYLNTQRVKVFLDMCPKDFPAMEFVSAYPQYFTAPASTKYHGSHKGGLFDHSVCVYKYLCELTERGMIQWERDISPFIVGMFHDLCKADCYDPDDSTGCYRYAEKTLFHGHGEKSVLMLSQLIELTEEEIACIVYHMGAFTDRKNWGKYTYREANLKAIEAWNRRCPDE